jgi:hypothetical protein
MDCERSVSYPRIFAESLRGARGRVIAALVGDIPAYTRLTKNIGGAWL